MSLYSLLLKMYLVFFGLTDSNEKAILSGQQLDWENDSLLPQIFYGFSFSSFTTDVAFVLS